MLNPGPTSGIYPSALLRGRCEQLIVAQPLEARAHWRTQQVAVGFLWPEHTFLTWGQLVTLRDHMYDPNMSKSRKTVTTPVCVIFGNATTKKCTYIHFQFSKHVMTTKILGVKKGLLRFRLIKQVFATRAATWESNLVHHTLGGITLNRTIISQFQNNIKDSWISPPVGRVLWSSKTSPGTKPCSFFCLCAIDITIKNFLRHQIVLIKVKRKVLAI